jgi:L-erythro-3,5-diaminohexanoate dehydrogenase
MITRLGIHRSIEPKGALPQAARRLDASLPIGSDEILIDVERINVDAASFIEFDKLAETDGVPVERLILDTVRERGKLQNPVTGSGGMLIGAVREIGPDVQVRPGLEVGARVATLVSLTLTPLHLESIDAVDRATHQLAARGHAILFASGLWAPMPGDLPDALALAVFDVAGAPAAVDRIVRPDDEVLVLGCGKAGLLALARMRASRVFAVDSNEEAVRTVEDLGLADAAAAVDAADATAILETVTRWTDGRLCSKVFNFASGPGTEAASILAVRETGTIFFYGMATSFSRAALTAEGVGKDIDMRIGSGYLPGWTDLALETVRDNPDLRRHLESRYG